MRKYLRPLFLFACLLFVLTLAPNKIFAQATTPDAVPNSATTADENYQLNISESRHTENDYQRSTQVEVKSDAANQAKVVVGVGAAVKAENITILLRGVTGNVRFRASLESLRQRIEQSATTPPPNR